MSDSSSSNGTEGIAVIGLAGRFPGASDVEQLWRNLRDGVESIAFFTREELEAAGVDPAQLDDPSYIRASGALRDVDLFDASFFDFSPREAELMDPQHRFFLECSWEALENAGYDSESYDGAIGIFGGMGMTQYLIRNLLSHRSLLARIGPLQARLFNDKDFLASTVAFRLNLTGPSITVQTACSTSLVAACLACQSLLQYQCDIALAGGVSIGVPQPSGYPAVESVMSPDGHCRAFDARARGTVEGSGVGVVVLKRLSDALADGDTIHAVIKGFATNNDGSFKMGYTAPSVDGQMEVIAMAQAVAGVSPETVTYVEAHGTGTPMGDPIEVTALTEVFAAGTDQKGFCGLGSIKTNIGHLDAAAGVASLIKTVLAIEKRILPPSLHFETPNPEIDFANSPFYVNTEARPWNPAGMPRRAGVSSFALGGVNAHLVLEEAPEPEPSSPALPWQLLVLSARTAPALERTTDNLIGYLKGWPEMTPEDFADLAHTLQAGRRPFRHRRLLVCRDREDALACLESRDPRRVLGAAAEPQDLQAAFLFPGVGNHHVGMARDLYRAEPGFRERFDDCAERLLPLIGADLRTVLYPEGEHGAEARTPEARDLRDLLRRSRVSDGEGAGLGRTTISHPAIFAVEYALAGLLMDWGLRPQAMIGFSIGEYVAACLAGVFSLDDALRLIAGRARLIDGLPQGAMLAVLFGEAEVQPLLGEELSISAVSGPSLTVVGGPEPAVAALEERLTREGHVCRRLQTTHAFHSRMMEPIVPRFLELFRGIELRAPEIPYLSNVTGTWITPEQATSPAYWVEHLRRTVRFADGVEELWREPGRVLLEAGPGQTLSAWALQHPAAPAGALALPALRHSFDRHDDRAFLLGALGRLWLAGMRIDWRAFWTGQRRRRIPLPTYPFERQRYWIEAARPESGAPWRKEEDAFPESIPAGGLPRGRAAEAPVSRPAAVRGVGIHPRPDLGVAFAEPRDATEWRVAEILQEILHLDRVGIHDGFFDLGGDSLLATRLIARLNQELGGELTLRSVFESPTAAELAAVVGHRSADGPGVPRGRIERRKREAAPPLSFAQQRMWVLDQLEPGNPFYNVPAASELLGPLDPAALARSFAEIVRRHESLRTTFQAREGLPYQVIAPPCLDDLWPLPVIDLSGLQGRGEIARRLAAEEARRPFDLARGPLLRTSLLRLEPAEHVLLLTLHHIVSDGWSNRIVTSEMASLYEAFAAGRPSPLRELPVQYADFAAWQAEWLQGRVLEEQLEYWKDRLAGGPAYLDLPADRPRPPVQSYRGARLPLAIPLEQAAELAERSREQGGTLFMAVLAVLAALLARWTDQEDVRIGSPVANRRHPEVEGLIGFFVNTLVMRMDLAGDPSFRELLERARETAHGAFSHQDLPFEKLVEELQPERDLSRSPLFQVLFVFQNTPGAGEIDLAAGTMRRLDIDPGVSHFDLMLDLEETAGGLLGAIEYSTDLFERATIERLRGHFLHLLAAAAADPGARLSELPLLGAEERRQLLGEWGGAASSLRGGGPVHRLVEEQARRVPEAPAVEGPGSGSLTYRELNRRANRLAHHLRRLGVEPETRVALSMERSPELAVSVLGVLKAGGTCVPLDPEYPAERLDFMLEDSGAVAVLTREGLSGFQEGSGGSEDEDPVSFPGSAALAYILYTSGSTGRPKGVGMSHGALASLAAWQLADTPGLWRTLQFAPLSFDVSFQEIFATWGAGGSLILVSEEARRDPAALWLRLREQRVERLFLPFVALQQLAEAARGEGELPPLREVITAGEALQITPAVADLFQRLPGARLHNQYGPTETHVVTAETLTGEPAAWPALPPIGRPVAGSRVRVLDRALQPSPAGVPGELAVGGASVARGYVGRPDATAERFVPDPFGGAGDRLYRTGDRARFLADGRLEFLGRLDAQVKIRGFRVEPGEVEAALALHPAVSEAAVATEEAGAGKRLSAWIVPRGEAPSPAALRAFLKDRLPDFMVPAAFAVIDSLPLTPSGKVDRRALSRSAAAAPASEEHVPPRTAVEELLAGLWSEVLGVARIGAFDDFFALGGHSLIATQLLSRIRASLSVELPLRALFEAPVLADLAARIEAQLPPATVSPQPPAPLEDGVMRAFPAMPGLDGVGDRAWLPIRSSEGPAASMSGPARPQGRPLSFAQHRLWFIDQLEPGSPLYNIPAALRVTGTLRPDVLACCLAEVERRHEVLRTVFVDAGGLPVQSVQPAASSFPVPVVDLSGLPEAVRSSVAMSPGGLAEQEAARPFDLACGPLWRALLLRLEPDEHLFLLTLHHIVSDAWSIGILIREAADLYSAFSQGRPSRLPELPAQYADLAERQRARLGGDALGREIAFWRRQLAGAPAVLELPVDRPRTGAGRAFRGAALPVWLPRGTAGGLRVLARGEGATLFMALLAGFQAFLARETGELDIVVGTPVAGRNHLEAEALVGLFVNTLVLRTDLTGDPGFRALVGRVREASLAAQAHQELPFERLVEELEPERSLDRTPLFQVLFQLQNTPREELAVRGLTLAALDLELAGALGQTAKFDLTLALEEYEDGLRGVWKYDAELFDAPTVARLSGHFSTLLAGVVECPGALLSELPLLTAPEARQVLGEWNDTQGDYPAGRCLHELFEEQADRTPEAVAVTFEAETLTYRDLDLRASRLAAHLRSLGVGPEVPVAICAERSFEMVVGLLGILKAGGAYVPLDPEYPRDRLAFLLADSGAPVLLIQEMLLGRVPVPGDAGGAVRTVLLEEEDVWPAAGGARRASGAQPDGVAYVIYTSGSTGIPKGVAVPHRGAVNRLAWAQRAYPLTAADTVLQTASFSFDFSVWECFGPLLAGGRLALAVPGGHRDAAYLVRAIAEQGVTVLHFVPSMLQVFLEEPGVERCGDLWHVLSGGEALTAELQKRFFERMPASVELWNQYGPTEVSIDATARRSRRGERLGASVPIGGPIANGTVYVLDRNLLPVPVGVAGELYLGGDGLARGYLGRPALTAERFVPDPFGPDRNEPGARLYRTGDRVRWLPAGELEFLGRLDHQVKVRGVRIELGEVEALLLQHPSVRDAAVVAQDAGDDRRLAAFVVERDGGLGFTFGDPSVQELAVADLRSFLRERLPSYMVPSAWAVLDALPLTPAGKLDRRALALRTAADSVPAEISAPPRTPMEILIAGVWAEVLGREQVGIRDGFFDLGGHSLLATQVVSRIRALLRVELPLRALFEEPTVEGLAARVERLQPLLAAEALVAPVVAAGPRPLSFAQERLWFIDQLEPDSPLYNIPVALRISGPLQPSLLARCLTEIERRHEVLRTVFPATDGSPVQVALPADRRSFPLPRIDLSGLPEAERAALGLAVAAAEARRPFDLRRGPLWRGLLLRLGEAEHLALLTMHHIVSDGWSMGLLVREIAALYNAFSSDRLSPLPALPVQYADFAIWQRRRLQGDGLERELSYWRERLAGAPALLELPADRPRPAAQSHRGALLPLRLSEALTRGLLALARHEGATPFMVLLAAFETLLSRLSGQEDLTVGTPVAGRNHVEVEGLIGFFVNTLVLRGDLRGDPSFRSLLARAREESLAAHLHQELPFEKLVEELAPERSLSHTPLFQAMLSLQNTPRGALALPGLALEPLEDLSQAAQVAKFDLTLSFAEVGGEFAGSLEYNTDLFDAATVERWAGHLLTLLTAAMESPDSRLSGLPLLSAEELGQLLAWNDAAAPSEQGLLHELFERQADLDPEAIALRLEGETPTYGGLEARSNRLAHRLRRLGVHPEAAVGLSLERSLDWIVALLAIWKSGGAYLPLDPAYPQARRAFLLEDAKARFLITRRLLLGDLSAPVVVCLEEEDLEGESMERPLPVNTPFHTAYLLYTSGSTGEPKGVAVEHGPAVVHARNVAREYALAPGDRNLQFAAASFDVSIEQIVSTLSAGAELVLRGDDLWNPADLSSRLAALGVTVANLPTAYWQQWAREGEVPAGALRLVIAGGEAMAPETARLWGGRLPLLNAYGPTEAVMTATLYQVPPEPPPGVAVSIGRPMAHRTAHVLDRAFHPQPAGIPGELCLGGLLGRGYLNLPGLTAERFIPDPFGGSVRLYRTGDLARRLPSGGLEYLGRLDHQVKVRGFRIELGEIEAALAGHPDVRESAVVLREDVSGDRRLVAYVAGPALETASLRAFLGERLPDHMVPAAFVQLPALPLTPAGKVDRRALPAPDDPAGRGRALQEFYAAPRTPVEEVVAAIWSQVLDFERIGIHDNFFELGGHSLLATQVSARLRRAFQIEMPLRDLFEAPTVAGLSVRVDKALRAAEPGVPGGVAAPPILPLPDELRARGAQLSFAQQRLWLVDHLEPGNTAYNVPFAVRIDGPLRPDFLGRAFTEIARRHEALRTTFELRGDEPIQVIAAPAPVPMPLLDLEALPEAERWSEARRIAHEYGHRLFDLSRGPVFRGCVVRLAGEVHVLSSAMHHIVSDEWSARILFREVVELYGAYREGRPSPLAELPVQYADYAVWQRQWLTGAALERQLAYWRGRLGGGDLPVLELPIDRPRPSVQTYHGSRRAFDLPAAASVTLRALARREGASLFMTLLAAFQVLLRRLTGQTDIAVGAPVTGRDRVEVEGLIGFFLNTLVIRTDLSGDPGFRTVLQQVREHSLGAYAHQDLPFEKLVDELRPKRSLSHSPLFQALFVLVHTTPGSVDSFGLRLSPFTPSLAAAKFDLTLSIMADEASASSWGEIEYNTDLFDASTVLRFAGHFLRLIDGVAADPDRPLSELPLLAPEEVHQVSREWNDRPALAGQELCIHERFEIQAARTPDRPAVAWAGGNWSYAELNGRANLLAAELRRRGVGLEDRVGVCAERGPELAAALLAVLKAGGAYVPLDPAYPRDRLAFMLADAGARVLMVQEALSLPVPVDPSVVLRLRGPREDWGEAPANPVSGAALETLCYLIYTSGSTGRPKGAALPHSTLANLIGWQEPMRGAFDEEAGLRTLQFVSPSFDVSLQEAFATWASGGTLVFAAEEVRRDPGRLLAFLTEERIERLFLPYVSLQQLAEQAAGPVPAAIPESLREIVTAGERLQITPQLAALCERLPALRERGALRNQYGPSEAHVVTEFVLTGSPAGWPALPPIGRPIPGASAQVLDPRLRPVPVGVSGELALGGVCLARGYLNRPDLTAERFIPDASGGRPGERLYRTGDLVRLRPSGDLEFLGRIDQQVKVRGFRIEPGEIEVVLASHPRLQDSAVVVREDVAGDRRLIAYVVPEAGEEADPVELRDFLRERVPAYMVPAAFVPLPALPLTASGKVDRAALPAPEALRGLGAEYVAPQSGLERSIAAVIGEVLGIERVGLEDNFFDLGVHSLLMVRAANALTEKLGRRVQVLEMFRFATVAALARHLSEGEETPSREQFEQRAGARRQSMGRRRDRRDRRNAAMPAEALEGEPEEETVGAGASE